MTLITTHGPHDPFCLMLDAALQVHVNTYMPLLLCVLIAWALVGFGVSHMSYLFDGGLHSQCPIYMCSTVPHDPSACCMYIHAQVNTYSPLLVLCWLGPWLGLADVT